MPQLIFVNLPVTDLPRSIRFYEAIGARLNPQFTDDTAACMVFSETIHAMLLTHPKYAMFTAKPVADTHKTSAALICLSAEDRAGVDRMAEAAAPAGGRTDPGPVQDHGFMYGRSFEDPDGHHWEVMWMDLSAMQPPAA